jgi:streptomycin 6-kinase
VTAPIGFAELLQDWELSRDDTDPLPATDRALAVRTAEGRAAVLVGDADRNAHLALRHWAGHGAVELLRADPHRHALLVERAGADLAEHWDLAAAEVVAQLYGRLHVAAPPQLPTVNSELATWCAAVAGEESAPTVPRRLIEQATTLAADLASDPASTGTLLHTNLHYGNVLAGDREPWLAISPRPRNGDRHYELAPMLWHRWDELAGGVRAGIRGRFATLVEVAGLDEDRARAWVIVRAVHRATRFATRQANPADRDRLTVCVTLAKAVQD